jgi:hypothetical protein
MPEFSLLSLNTFGVPFYISGRRIARLVNELNRLAPTVICLQEIQQNAYIPILQHGLGDYPHLAFERKTLAPKGGLFTASRNMPVHQKFFPFPNRGRWLSIGFSDWALYKGVLAVELEVEGRRIIVLNTHMHANYAGNWLPGNGFAGIQHDQVRFLTELVHAQPEDSLLAVCGDFNFPRKTFLYEELILQSGLIDPLAGDLRPTYRPFPLVPSRWAISLDFVLYRAPLWSDLKIDADIIPIENSSARSPLLRFLTDHCALTLNANWRN